MHHYSKFLRAMVNPLWTKIQTDYASNEFTSDKSNLVKSNIVVDDF